LPFAPQRPPTRGVVAPAQGVRYIAFRLISDAPNDEVPFYGQAVQATALFTLNFLENFPPFPAAAP
jgi:adenosylhomocysteine nucleosidase